MKKIVSLFGENNETFNLLNEKATNYAKEKGFEYEWVLQNPYNKKSAIEALKNADYGVIDIEPYDESIFKEICERNKMLVRFGVGYDKVNLTDATNYGLKIARTTAANTNAVAEMALSLMLLSRRKFIQTINSLKENKWEKIIGNEIIGSKVGIIGFGNIGKKLAELLEGFNVELLVYDPYPNMEAIESFGAKLVTLEDLFSEADAISIHVPYSNETHNLFDSKYLSLMKKTAVIVNTSRGNLIDENDLYKLLKNNEIAGAGLDVFAVEPLEKDSPLRELDNIVLTAHVSSQTVESLWNIYKMAIDIIEEFDKTGDSIHILNK